MNLLPISYQRNELVVVAVMQALTKFVTFNANHQRTPSVEIRRICSGENHESFIDCHVMLQIHLKSSWHDQPPSHSFLFYQLGGVNMFRN